MKKNGVNSPEDFAKLSDEDREKLMKEIDDVINMQEIEDKIEGDNTPDEDSVETPKDDSKGATAANESIYNIHSAIRAVQENTGKRKDYASIKTILNRMYGEQ